MPVVPFDQLPSDARLWVFAASRPLTTEERDRLLAGIDALLDGWTAHRRALTSARDWRYDRFLLIGVDERASGVSGCSIDALLRGIGDLERELQVTLVDPSPVLFRENGAIVSASRDEFAALAKAGRISGATIVFDNTVDRVGGLADRWEVPAARSWHRRAFDLA